MVLLDANKEAEKSYQIAYTPTVFLVDRQGKLVGKRSASASGRVSRARRCCGACWRAVASAAGAEARRPR